MIGAAREASILAELKREIRRIHGCASEFERFVTLPEAAGRARRVVAIFSLNDHSSRRCYAWLERADEATEVVAVLQSSDVRGPEEAVRHVREFERLSRDRWAQEYA